MDDADLAESLYVSNDGEVRLIPPASVEKAQNPVTVSLTASGRAFVTQTWHPISDLPLPARLAMARLYREQEEAREIAVEWFDNYLHGYFDRFNGELHALVERCMNLAWMRSHGRPER